MELYSLMMEAVFCLNPTPCNVSSLLLCKRLTSCFVGCPCLTLWRVVRYMKTWMTDGGGGSCRCCFFIFVAHFFFLLISFPIFNWFSFSQRQPEEGWWGKERATSRGL
ncbi:unnamed protein product [Heterosigma akashiwo]